MKSNALRTMAFAVAVWLGSLTAGPSLAAQEGNRTAEKQFDAAISSAKSNMVSDTRTAAAAAREAEALSQQLPKARREEGEATALWLRAEAALRSGNPKAGVDYADKGLEIIAERDDLQTLRGNLLLARGRTATQLSMTEVAARSFFDALDVFTEVEDSRKQSMVLQAIGSIHRDAQSYDDALEFYKRAEKVYAADTVVALSIANNYANILFELEEYDQAREGFVKALSLAEELESPLVIGRVLTNLADLEAKSGRLTEAEIYAQRAHQSLSGEGGAEWDRYVYGVDAGIALAWGELEKAKELIETGFEGVDLETTSLPFEHMHLTARRVYEALDDYERAFAHQRAHHRIENEAKKIAASSNLAIFGARFRFTEQQLNIERLRNEQLSQSRDLLEADRRQTVQNVIITAGGLLMILAMISASGAWSAARRIKRINGELSSTVNRLAEEIEQRELVEKDLIRARDEAEQADRMKSTFLATMSHELRTPMNGILGFAEMLLADDVTPEQREQLEVIENSGRALLTLINDILDLSQIEAGRLKLRSAPFDLRSVTENAAKLLKTKAQEKALGIAVHLDPRLPDRVTGDEDRIRQILINLIGNAVKFTETGAVSVHVLPGQRERSIRFDIRDSGIGIPAEKQANLFKRFSQIEEGSARRFEGSGLGLAISQELAAAMGGAISCVSAPGEGSCFSFEVPLIPEEFDLTKHRPLPEFEGMRVLLVDSNRISRDMVSLMIKSHGADVVETDNATDAVQALRAAQKKSEPFDGVLIDGTEWELAELVITNIEETGVANDIRFGVLGTVGAALKDRSDVRGTNQPVFDGALTGALRFVKARGMSAARDLTAAERRGGGTSVELDIGDKLDLGRVLVVDDIPVNRMLAEAVLNKIGVRTISAENGQVAVDLCSQETFSVILMDIFMPVMGGVEAAEILRSQEGPNQNTPIFALTASTRKEEAQQALDAGMVDIITKPINVGELRSAIERVVDPANKSRHRA